MTEGSESDIDEEFEHESGASSENGEHKYSEKVTVYFLIYVLRNGYYTINHLKSSRGLAPNFPT